jgi:glyoxylase-like metal-dependent hydrolase (beta-lactamase superfamily II)
MKNILISNEIQTSVFFCNSKEVKVHAVQTGLISVKENFLNQKGKGFMSKLNIVFGNTYADFMPIWVWVIEHPEGIIVVDTGDVKESGYKVFYKNETLGAKFRLKVMSNKRNINKQDELDAQLSRLGIRPEQVSKVVLTHLHGDHTDGLKFFPENEIIVNEAEYRKPYGNLATTYPKWFNPTLVSFLKDRIDFFDSAYPVTKSEDVLLIPTPGHTYHHASVLLKTDNGHILFAGDTSYKHQQLLDNKFAGANIDFVQTQKTYNTILRYAEKYPVIYLPSHDENSANRLVNREYLIK